MLIRALLIIVSLILAMFHGEVLAGAFPIQRRHNDDIEASAPLQIPGGGRQLEEDWGYPDEGEVYNQFVRQVANRYIDEEGGTACIIELPTHMPDTLPWPKTITLFNRSKQ